MEVRKRKAEVELLREDDDVINSGFNDKVDSPEKKNVGSDKPTSQPLAPAGTGFLAYANKNPFASAIAASKNPFSASTSTFGNFNQNKLAFSMPPPLVVPSPKSPKSNPFSSPSPAHNPFMTIVDSKDDLWKTMANDKLSAEESARTIFFGEVKGKKSPLCRSSFLAATMPSNNEVAAATAGNENNNENNDKDEDEGNNSEDEVDTNDSGAQSSMKVINMPENLKIVTGEEDDECLLQFRAKLYRLTSRTNTLNVSSESNSANFVTAPATILTEESKHCDEKVEVKDKENILTEVSAVQNGAIVTSADAAAEWVEVGIGPLKVLVNKQQQKPLESSVDGIGSGSSSSGGRLVMRREEKKGGIGTKLLLNVRLSPNSLSVTRQSDKTVRILCVNYCDMQDKAHTAVNTAAGGSSSITAGDAAASVKLSTYLIKTKTTEESDDLYEVFSGFINDKRTSTSSLSSSS